MHSSALLLACFLNSSCHFTDSIALVGKDSSISDTVNEDDIYRRSSSNDNLKDIGDDVEKISELSLSPVDVSVLRQRKNVTDPENAGK